MRNLYACAAAAFAAGLATAPAMAQQSSYPPPGPADGYYNDMGSARPSVPDDVDSLPASRTRAFAPHSQTMVTTPAVPMWQEQENRYYGRIGTPNLGFHSGGGPWGPSSQ